MNDIIKEALEKGCIELRDGLYLFSQESIIREQESWGDEDESKNYDFTTSLFWLTDNAGGEPEGIDTPEELADYLK